MRPARRLIARLILALILVQVAAGLALPGQSAAARGQPAGVCSSRPTGTDADHRPAAPESTAGPHCLFCLPLFQGHLLLPAAQTAPDRAEVGSDLRLPVARFRFPPDPTRCWAPPRAPPLPLRPPRT
ncbi:DUF2946 family protein [Phaeospirillum tilakii]|uniref:DUF2946 family protein n=1 Tax=Phaeospirillum tilakii TaxID=741673 RepID=A0ABW5C8Z0_9PROT